MKKGFCLFVKNLLFAIYALDFFYAILREKLKFVYWSIQIVSWVFVANFSQAKKCLFYSEN